MNITEKEIRIIEEVKKGDKAAFEELYRLSVDDFKKKAMVLLSGETAAYVDDAIQETYVKIFNNISKLEDNSKFPAWGMRICNNTCVDMFKREIKIKANNQSVDKKTGKRGEEVPVTIDDIRADEYRKEFNPEAVMVAQETKEILDSIIEDLPVMQRACIMMWKENIDEKTIAKELQLPQNTVKSNIYYAKAKIKKNVLALEARGVKLYGMSPVVYFLFQADLFTSSYIPGGAAAGSAASISAILEKVSENTVFAGASAAKATAGGIAKIASHKIAAAVIAAVVLGTGGIGIYKATEHKVPEESPVAQTETEEKEDLNNRAVYDDIIEEYRQAYNGGEADFSKEKYPDVNGVIVSSVCDVADSNGRQQLLYSYHDINKDGRDELVFIAKSYENEGYVYVAVYGSDGKQAYNLTKYMTSLGYPSSSGFYIYKDGTIMYSEPGGVTNTSLFQISNDGTKFDVICYGVYEGNGFRQEPRGEGFTPDKEVSFDDMLTMRGEKEKVGDMYDDMTFIEINE